MYKFVAVKYVCKFLIIVSFIYICEAAPLTWTAADDDDTSHMMWVNPCGHEPLATAPSQTDNGTAVRRTNERVMKSLRDNMPTFVLRLSGKNMNAIDTSNIQKWFRFNTTYAFLIRINPSGSYNLRKRHVELQHYVGAFQFLAQKQKNFDRINNEGHQITLELTDLLHLSKNLLCEVETVINKTKRAMPSVYSREQIDIMNRKFRNINMYEIDDLDTIFAKVRFHEYVKDLERLIRPVNRNLVRNLVSKRRTKNHKSNKLNKSNHPKNNSKSQKLF